MKVCCLFFVALFSLNTLAQTREEILEDFRRQRQEMMKQMIQLFQDDFDSDLFQHDIDPFGKQKKFMGSSQSVKIEEKYNDDGSIEIVITPKDKNIALDIKTENNRITIKSEKRVETKNDQNGNTFSSFSSSSSTQSIGVPEGYKATGPVVVDKGLKFTLTPIDKVVKTLKPKRKLIKTKPRVDRVPIGKRPGEDTL